MNSANKKIRELEKNVLPETPTSFSLSLKNDAEIELNRKANQIRRGLDFDVLGVWHNNKLTFEQKKKLTIEAYGRFSDVEKQILTMDSDFYRRRLEDLLIDYFETKFPCKNREPLLRVTWFFDEMDKLSISQYMEDSEWYHNRDEDDPDFDDFKWWDNVDAKIRGFYPKGVFTKESYEAVRDYFDEKESEAIREYWKAHPEEFKEYMEKINKKLESMKT